MKPKWQKLASLAQEICTLWFQFVGAVFASKGYPLKKIFRNFLSRNICSLFCMKRKVQAWYTSPGEMKKVNKQCLLDTPAQ